MASVKLLLSMLECCPSLHRICSSGATIPVTLSCGARDGVISPFSRVHFGLAASTKKNRERYGPGDAHRQAAPFPTLPELVMRSVPDHEVRRGFTDVPRNVTGDNVQHVVPGLEAFHYRRERRH